MVYGIAADGSVIEGSNQGHPVGNVKELKNGKAYQVYSLKIGSSYICPPSNAIDGKQDTMSATFRSGKENWWLLKLDRPTLVTKVRIRMTPGQKASLRLFADGTSVSVW